MSNSSVYLIVKRLFDIIASIFGLLVLIIILPFTALIIRIESSGPIFFKQERVGFHGKHFFIYKFRTMYKDADYQRKVVHGKSKNGFLQIENDPRTTKVGKVLRKSSIDEFPQFINILRGDMSLIGPRPLIIDEIKMLTENHRRRQEVMPGLTGYAQVRGRSHTPIAEREIFDIYYIEHMSIWTDVKIIIRTIMVLFKKDAAI